jgi:hypothetical protein
MRPRTAIMLAPIPPAKFLKGLRPDHEVSAARSLKDQREAGRLERAPVVHSHGLGAGDDPTHFQISAQEGDRMWIEFAPPDHPMR